MEFILVLQWPATVATDYDTLISVEDRLESGLDDAYGYVDGHDFGSGQMNIFVHTDLPIDAFRNAEAALRGDPGWAMVRAAYRPIDGGDYTVVWPETLQEFSVS